MKRILSLAIALCICTLAVAQTTVTSLKVNRMTTPQGVADSTPSLSWVMEYYPC